jgi:hypothetical protein
MIGKFLETLTDAQLQRVADAKPEYWICADFGGALVEQGCLLAHVYGRAAPNIATTHPLVSKVYRRYDRMNANINRRDHMYPGDPAHPVIVRMIQDRARRILFTRALSHMDGPREAVGA